MRTLLLAGLCAGLTSTAALAQPSEPKDAASRRSTSTPAAAHEVETSSERQYRDLLARAAHHRALAPDGHPPLARVKKVAERLIANAAAYNKRVGDWKWEVNLIGSRHVNVLCMPGGKIAVFTGAIDALRLSDDEIAFAIAHEIAHAVQEHQRDRITKAKPADWLLLNASVFDAFLGYGDAVPQPESSGEKLLILKYPHDDESDADGVALELAARSGFDPRAAVAFWEKMGATQGLPAWALSHPGYPARIKDLEARMPTMLQIYAQATGRDAATLPPYPPAR